MKNEPDKKAKNKRLRIIVIIISALIPLLIAIFCLKSCSDPQNENHKGLVFDNNAVTGGWSETDIDSIKEDLNRKVEAGMINISMNTAPKFESGNSEGNLMIVNEQINNYPQIVVITRNDTGETVYESGGIPIGSKIEKAKLNVDLPAGKYECTAMFHNIDPETGDSLGCAGAEITITVLN